jgi:uncharacterized protein YlaI
MEDCLSLLKEQEYQCAICNHILAMDNNTLNIDHCHKTGKVRGLLCFNCNVGLGNFRDNPINLKKALAYLGKHSEHT